jgi:hypothetical protein
VQRLREDNLGGAGSWENELLQRLMTRRA